jgi:DNA-binding CsgD family transcriptional regulator/predicted transcriptional regulator
VPEPRRSSAASGLFRDPGVCHHGVAIVDLKWLKYLPWPQFSRLAAQAAPNIAAVCFRQGKKCVMPQPMVAVPMLLELGLQERAARVWTAMLADPGIGVDALALFLELPEHEVRLSMDVLADLALVRASRQTAGLLVPVAAEAGLAVLIRRREDELVAQQFQIAAHRDRINGDLAVLLNGDDRHIEHIVGADAIQSRFEQLAFTVTESADSLLPGATVAAEVLEAARPLDTEVLARGVQMRLLYQEAIRNDAATIGYARDLAALGADVRTAPTLPQRLFLADRRIALVPLDPANPARGAAMVSAPGAIASLIDLFELVWTHAAPLDVGNPVDVVTGLTDTERDLLTLLAAGVTDESAAKRLGISRRTVSRCMTDLMIRLEASSRFEAGLKAARRGWL